MSGGANIIYPKYSHFRNRGGVAIRQPYLRVVGMDHAVDGSGRGAPSFTYDEVRFESNCGD